MCQLLSFLLSPVLLPLLVVVVVIVVVEVVVVVVSTSHPGLPVVHVGHSVASTVVHESYIAQLSIVGTNE